MDGSSPRRPWTLVHVAMSADGKISAAERSPARFGSREDRRRLPIVRAAADVVLVGARTFAVERSRMGIPNAALRRWRRDRGMSPEPLRAVLSPRLNLPTDHPLLRDPGKGPRPDLIVFTSRHAPARRRAALEKLAGVVVYPGTGLPDPLWIGRFLRSRLGTKRLLLEGGGMLNSLFFEAGAVDELFMTLCPLLVGGSEAATPFDGNGFRNDEIRKGRLLELRRRGNELYLRYRFPASTPPCCRGLDPPFPAEGRRS